MKILNPYIRGWLIIVMFATLAYLITSKYLNYVTPMFESTAKLKLADMAEGVANSNLFKDFDVFATTQKINAEIEVLTSHALISRTLDNLKFDVQVFRDGKINHKELYNNSPIEIIPINFKEKDKNQKYKLILNWKFEVIIIDKNKKEYKGKINDTISLNESKLIISLNKRFIFKKKKVKIFDSYSFVINSRKNLINEIIRNLDVTKVDKDIAVIRISYKSANPEKAAAFPNALAQEYIQDYIQQKYNAANITVNFLENRISDINKKLKSVENDILGYRNQKGITNISQETETDLRKISQLKIQQTNYKMNLDAIKSLENYILSGKDNFLNLAPNFEAFSDLLSTEMIKKIKQLQSDKKDLETLYTQNDEKVILIDKKIEDLTSYIIESIKNTRKNLEIKYNNLNADIIEAEKVFVDVPEKEKMITILNREFNIFQESYNFLNEKKIEAEIAKSAKISFHRVITPAYINKEPVSPNKAIIKIVSTFLGIILAIILIFIVHALKDKINNEETIEKNSLIPIIDSIPKINSTLEKEKFFFKLLTKLEVKKLVQTGDIIAFNGYRIKEGTKFVCENLIHVFENQQRKILFIDFQAAVYPEINPGLNPIKISEYVSVLNIGKNQIKQYSNEKIRDYILQLVKDYSQTIILNDQINEQYCLPVMNLSNLNLVVFDTRLTKTKKITEINLIKNDFNFSNINFIVNRAGYNPSFFREIMMCIKSKIKKK